MLPRHRLQGRHLHAATHARARSHPALPARAARERRPTCVFNATYGAPNRWEVAHELTHTFQYAYRYHGSCASYNNWDEAVANWGASYLYPRDDSEHAYPWLLRDPERSLADASYEGWPFPYAMQQLHGTGTIRSIYAQTERLDVLQAIDAGVPGGMKKAWPEFALASLEPGPVSPTFEEWDKLGQLPEANRAPITAEQLDPGAAGQVQVDVPLGGLEPLSRVYRHFKLGPGITQITIEKPSYADLSVQALVHTRDGTWKTEDWYQRQPVWCPRDPKDRPDELILVISNTSLTQASPGNVPLRLLATNIGCSRYSGEASGTSTYTTGTDSTEESWKATGLVYDRILADDIKAPRFIFNLTAGSVSWSMSGHSNGCAVKAGPATLPVRADGYNGQLDIRSTSGRAGDMGPPLLCPGVRIPRGPGNGHLSYWHVYALVRAPHQHPLHVRGCAQPSRRPARRDPRGHRDAYGHRRPDRHLELASGARAMSARLAIVRALTSPRRRAAARSSGGARTRPYRPRACPCPARRSARPFLRRSLGRRRLRARRGCRRPSGPARDWARRRGGRG